MSMIEDNINDKLVNIETKLTDTLNLIDYKELCERQLGYNLDQKEIKEFISEYNNFFKKLYEINYEQNSAPCNEVLVIFLAFFLALVSIFYFKSSIVFILIIMLGVGLGHFIKVKTNKKCKGQKEQLKRKWKVYRSNLPFSSKVISIMEDIVYDYQGNFKYPFEFYKELYLRLKNNMEDD